MYTLTLQCDAEATSGPNVHHHHWRYCESCRRKLRVDVPQGPGFGIMWGGNYIRKGDLMAYTRDVTKASIWPSVRRARQFLESKDPRYAYQCSVVMLVGLEK